MAARFIKNNKFCLAGFFVLAVVVIVNLFPSGYVFVGGDTPQLISAKNNFINYFYEGEGRTGIFYFLFYLLDSVGVNDTVQLSFYLGLFIFGSYISFDILSRLIFGRKDSLVKSFCSLFYALNLFTLYVFTANWGYSHFESLYISIPILVGLYMKFIKTLDYSYGAWFVLSLFLSSSGFANPAFAISFSIFLLVLTVMLAIVEEIDFGIKTFKGLMILSIFSLLVNVFWLLPLIPQMKSGVEGVYSSSVIELNWILNSTSNPIWNTLSLTHYSGDYFPDNFPYKSLLFFKSIFFLLSFLPILVIASSSFFINKLNDNNKKLFLCFLAMLLLFVLMVARVRPPFETINHFLFNLWGMNTLRGYDKMAIYIPFLFPVLLFISFSRMKKRELAGAFMLLILIAPLPFFIGKLQQNMSYRFSANKAENKDYRKSDYSFLVKIPQPYYEIRDKINSDKEDFFIATLPHNLGESGAGSSKYPKWKLYGADITRFLYNKKFIEANNFYFNQWNFSKSFSEIQDNPGWIVRLLGSMNVRYLIYHKDVSSEFILDTQSKIEELEREKLIIRAFDSEYFTLYEINQEYFAPYINWQKEDVSLEKNYQLNDYDAKSLKENIQRAGYEKINPKKFLVDYDANNLGKNLVIQEPYSENWKAYLEDGGRELEIKNHYKANGYANGWRIEGPITHGKIMIEYYPIRLLRYGLYVSIVSILLVIIFLIRYYYVKKK